LSSLGLLIETRRWFRAARMIAALNLPRPVLLGTLNYFEA